MSKENYLLITIIIIHHPLLSSPSLSLAYLLHEVRNWALMKRKCKQSLKTRRCSLRPVVMLHVYLYGTFIIVVEFVEVTCICVELQ